MVLHKSLGLCKWGPVDYVLVHPASSSRDELELARQLFEKEIDDAGLSVERERIGGNLFLKIHCPFDRLAFEAERIKLEMPLKGCEIKPNEPSCCKPLEKLLTTDDEVDFVSAPFIMKKIHLYEDSENLDNFFRPSLRSFLVYNILINLDIRDQLSSSAKRGPADTETTVKDDLISKRGLLYLLMKRGYSDSFVLHDVSADDPYYLRLKENSLEDYYSGIPSIENDQRRSMNNTWASFWKFQPLWKIRNYFGEKIAFYFAWEGTFITLLWIPSFIGLIIFLYGFYLGIKIYKFKECFNAFESENGTIVNATQRAIEHCSFTKRMKFLGEDVFYVIKEAFDNILTPFFSLIICLWGALFLEIWKRNRYTLAYQWDVNNYSHSEPDRPEFFGTQQKPDPVTGEIAWFYPFGKRFRKFLISALVLSCMVLIVFISVSGVIAYKVVMRRQFNCSGDSKEDTDRAQGNAIRCLVIATVIPSLLNAGSILLLGRVYEVVAVKLTAWENHRTQSEYDNALIIKLFAFQFANTYTSLFYIAFFRPENHGFQDNGVFGWGPEYKDTCHQGNCMSLLSFQVLVLMLMKPFPKFFKDIVVPYLIKYYRKVKKRIRKNRIAANQPQQQGNSNTADETDTADPSGRPASSHSAKQKVVNFIEREYLKPELNDFTMGEYNEKVIQFGYIVLFAASFPLAPLLGLIINCFDLRVDARRLLWLNRRPVAFIASDIGMWYPILRFVNFCGVVSNGFIIGYTSSFCDEFFARYNTVCTAEKRLAIVVAFEHLIFFSMYLINVIIPDIPANIKLAERREHYQVTKILEEGIVPALVRRPNTTESLAFPPLESSEGTQTIPTTATTANSLNRKTSAPAKFVHQRKSSSAAGGKKKLSPIVSPEPKVAEMLSAANNSDSPVTDNQSQRMLNEEGKSSPTVTDQIERMDGNPPINENKSNMELPQSNADSNHLHNGGGRTTGSRGGGLNDSPPAEVRSPTKSASGRIDRFLQNFGRGKPAGNDEGDDSDRVDLISLQEEEEEKEEVSDADNNDDQKKPKTAENVSFTRPYTRDSLPGSIQLNASFESTTKV